MLAHLECPFHQRLVLLLVLVLPSAPPTAGAAHVEVSRVVHAMHASGVAPPRVVEASWVASWLLHHQRHPAEDGLNCFQTIRFKMD